MGYTGNHYNHMPHNIPYYPPDAVPPISSSSAVPYRYPSGVSTADWSRDRDNRDNFDYRREYRAPPPSGTS